MHNIVNIINFVRGFDPNGKDYEMINTVNRELELCQKYEFPCTFLLQYDALIRQDYQEIFRNTDCDLELGIWIEIVKPLTEACGIPWRGRPGMDWDWHVNPGFLMAYTQAQREQLCDEIMEKFREIYGHYPKLVGSWLLDSYSMDYMSRKYELTAFVVCREQWGVDAYTLWGGYYNQGYYASKKNMLSPAQSSDCQIPVPVFRMLGIDPVYEYDNRRYATIGETFTIPYPIYTLEPSLKMGKSEHCVNWFMDTYFQDKTIHFAYAQMGQENSFHWSGIQDGWHVQMKVLKEQRDSGRVQVEKLSRTGEWFSGRFKSTPPTSIVAETDWSDNGLKSVWYDCKRYRTNLFLDKDTFLIRDIYLFDENYEERYYEEPCTEWSAIYDNLPVIDGVQWSNQEIRCGLYPEGTVVGMTVEKSGESQVVRLKLEQAEETIICSEDRIRIEGAGRWFFQRKPDAETSMDVRRDRIAFEHRGFSYAVKIDGNIEKTEQGYLLTPAENVICLNMNSEGRE